MESLAGITAFVYAAQLQSFAAAGRQLGVSPSAIGKSIKRLEDRLGVRVLNRSTRSVSLTAEGSVYFEHCARILQELSEAEDIIALGRAMPQGRLRLNLPVTLGRNGIVPKLGEFLPLYPEIELDISFNDRSIDLISEGIDIAVRIGDVPDSRLVARKIGRQRLLTCAAPAYLERCGRPLRPRDLNEHCCLQYRHPNTGRQQPWQFRSQGRDTELQVAGKLSFNDSGALVNAALAQLGIVQVPSYAALAAVEAGLLEVILADYSGIGNPISAVWPSSRHLLPKVRVFVDFLLQQATVDPAWEQSGAKLSPVVALCGADSLIKNNYESAPGKR